MKKTAKKWISRLCAGMIVVMLAVGAISPAVQAGNTEDWYYPVSLNAQYGKTSDQTQIRSKTDTTSVYLKSGESLAGAFLAYPWGCSSTGYIVRCNADGAENLVTQTNQVRRLRSMIYEEGYRYAGIKFELYTSNIGGSYVAWSPDSVSWS